jgi:hypothetical protein
VHETVALQRLESLGQHLLGDLADFPAQLAEAVRALQQRDQDQDTPAAGDVLEDQAVGAHRFAFMGPQPVRERHRTSCHESTLP